MSSIEDFLRENKPQVKEDPTFILEAQRRMVQVEGIKAQSSAEGLLRAARLFLQDYRQYLPMPVALLAITLAVVLFKRPARI